MEEKIRNIVIFNVVQHIIKYLININKNHVFNG